MILLECVFTRTDECVGGRKEGSSQGGEGGGGRRGCVGVAGDDKSGHLGRCSPPPYGICIDSYCFLGFLIVESKGKDGGKEGRKVLKEGGAREVGRGKQTERERR